MRHRDISRGRASNGNAADGRAARLPWRRRVRWRGPSPRRPQALIPLFCALVFVLVGFGCAPEPSARISGQPTASGIGQALKIPGGPWQRITPPSDVGRVLSFTPSPSDVRVAFLCGTAKGADAKSPVALWVTADGGATWTRAPLPAMNGLNCPISPNTTVPHAFIYDVTGSFPCAPPALYRTTDDGRTWSRLAQVPPAPSGKSCSTKVSFAGSQVVVEYASAGDSLTGTWAYSSGDTGKTWTPAFTGAPRYAYGLGAIVSTDASEMLQVAATTAKYETAALYTSEDAGRTWTKDSTIPQIFPDMLIAAPGASLATLRARDNLIYGLSEVQKTSLDYRTRIVARQANGGWKLVPPLPVAGTSPTRLGIAQVLAETPSGQLLAIGTDPDAPLPAADAGPDTLPESHTQWLWLWNPAQQRWAAIG
ncbi:MAG TPA: hypothetical protein VFY89_03860, partial [Ktedonobacterales bacterium]